MKTLPFAKKRKIYNYAGIKEIIPIRLGFVKCFLIKGESKLILVDTGVPGSATRITNKIKRMGFNPSQISLIIITHAHTDHSGSIQELKKITGAKVAVHKDEAQYLISGQSTEVTPVSAIGRLLISITKNTKRQFEGVKPDILIENEMSLSSFGIKGKVISTPGHTLGSVSIILDSRKCIIGDLLASFGKLCYPFFANDLTILKASLAKIMDSNAKEVYLSHGGAYSMDKIKKLFMNS
jgi:hydroxyacylglutathione hydrolase